MSGDVEARWEWDKYEGLFIDSNGRTLDEDTLNALQAQANLADAAVDFVTHFGQVKEDSSNSPKRAGWLKRYNALNPQPHHEQQIAGEYANKERFL